MEFWLSFNNGAEKLRLPIPPSEFSVKQGTKISTLEVLNLGEIGMIGKGQLASIELASFFPNQDYSFVQYRGFPKPYKCVQTIEKWRNSGKPIRLMITGTPINMACMIESFSYGEQDGTRDVYFSLSLKEYRFIKVNAVQSTSTINNGTTKQAVDSKRDASNKTVPKSYTVKKGDTLWAIAQKYYGSGTKWKTIADKNGIKDERKLQIGKVLVLP